MKKRSDLWVLLTVIVVFAVSLNLFRGFVGVTSPWFALLVMLCFLGVAAFSRRLFFLRLPRPLRKLGSWELTAESYRLLGVPTFGKLLRRTPLRYLNPVVYLTHHRGDYSTVGADLEAAEAAHFWAALLVAPYMVYASIQHRWSVLGWFVVIQVLGNLYPILHLRSVRGRLQRYLDRGKSRHARQSFTDGPGA
jgi:hypothetical protein